MSSARGWFVTGTDTGIGKTVIAGALAWLAREAGHRVGVFKPTATGCRHDVRLGLVCGDAEFLAHCAESGDNLATINPVRYSGELAPMVAAEREHKPIDWPAIRASWERIRKADVVIAEGAGGLLVPIDREHSMADLAKELGLPLIIVARPGLGTINHTLLTIEAARSRGLAIATVVINGYRPDSAAPAEESNPVVIGRLAKMPIPLIVPFDPLTNVEKGKIGESVLYPLRAFVRAAIGGKA